MFYIYDTHIGINNIVARQVVYPWTYTVYHPVVNCKTKCDPTPYEILDPPFH